jgi:hypothetical protein
VPKIPRAVSTTNNREGMLRLSSDVSARIPPSPLLFARITSIRYLKVMMTTSAQNTSEQAPITPLSVTSR